MEIKYTNSFFESLDKMFSPWGRFKTWVREHNPYTRTRDIVQRGTKGYGKNDWWSMNSWVGEVILNNLKEFKKQKRAGHPIGLTSKRWEKILDDMIDGWEILVSWDEVQMKTYNKHLKTATGEVKEDMFGEKYNTFTDEEREAYNKEINKIYKDAQRKAKLFVKYYLDLWD
jgi:hypothetical protein